MLVIYRLCSIPSTNPSPVFQDDKFKLNELCLKSFLKAYEGVDYKMIVLADNCDKETMAMARNLLPKAEIVETTQGINNSMLDAYERAFKQDEDILFQECDYIYQEGAGKKMEKAIKALGLVSPYDHLNFYNDPILHADACFIKLIDDYHFRSTERNTMTFGVRNDIFKANVKTFYKYGYLDGDVWYDMLDNGFPLFVPIPSLATHMAEGYLAPSVDWEAIWNTQL